MSAAGIFFIILAIGWSVFWAIIAVGLVIESYMERKNKGK